MIRDRRLSLLALLGLAVALVAATSAASTSRSGGISVRALPVEYSLEKAARDPLHTGQ